MHKASSSAYRGASEHAGTSAPGLSGALNGHGQQPSLFPKRAATDGHDVQEWLKETQYNSFDFKMAQQDIDLSHAPFLNALLTDCSDGADVLRYIEGNTYTDDVWGLPAPIIQTIRDIRTPTSSTSARETAVRRLVLLKNHLGGSNSIIPYNDWSRIWDPKDSL